MAFIPQQVLQVQRIITFFPCSPWEYMHLKVGFYLEWPNLDMSINLGTLLRLQT